VIRIAGIKFEANIQFCDCHMSLKTVRIYYYYRGISIPIQVLVLDSSISSTHHRHTGFIYSIIDKDSPVSIWALHKRVFKGYSR